eukprot:CAMPEP_0177627994 /NCGR_PEP_ID=MMETSP0419_2-20121207/31509_1 /TAXON_ID=582737 /ORGANISM="Tetraselmis sp., Strain GSL018" /LENGTH=879 /DNA_ID=CAMNT_0019129203 /DNA_START=60 /DNA_END=2700 /DNA_ORIENTATION=-
MSKVKRKEGRIEHLLESASWKPLQHTDNLLGGEEGGLLSMEVLDDPELMACLYPDHYGKRAGQSGAEQKKLKRRKLSADNAEVCEGQPEQSRGSSDTEDIESLRARLEKLEAENKRLKEAEGKTVDAEIGEKKKKKKKKQNQKKKVPTSVASNTRSGPPVGPSHKGEAEVGEPESLADVSAWADFHLHPVVNHALARLGFSYPTPVQAECVPAAIRDWKDVIGAAQTGSGKTLAFGLPIMHILVRELQGDSDAGGAVAVSEKRWPKPGPLRALVLAPTRELAMQVCKHLKAVGSVCSVGVVPILGGISAQKQSRLLQKRPAVIVATPGRLWDLLKTGEQHLCDMGSLSFLVIDEADRMMQHGQFAELSGILSQIQGDSAGEGTAADENNVPMIAELAEAEASESQFRPPKQPPQIFIFSATLTLPKDLRRRLMSGGGGAGGNSADLEALMDKLKFRGHPRVVDLTSERRVAEKVQEAYIQVSEEERDNMLYYLTAAHPGKTIVFANAISCIRRLASLLRILGIPAAPLHGGMQQRARLQALDRFSSGEVVLLVATDVAARGLDVKDIRCVIHYQLPASVDIYVHRSGRTARAEADGVSICLVTPKEIGRFSALQRVLKRDSPPMFPVEYNMMPAVRERVMLARKLDELERRQKKAKTEKDWKLRVSRELDIDLEEDMELGEDDQAEDGRRQKQTPKKKKAEKKGPAAFGVSGPLSREDAARAKEIQGKLQALLAEPLSKKFNKRFFAGQALSEEGGATQDSTGVELARRYAEAAKASTVPKADSARSNNANRAAATKLRMPLNGKERLAPGKTAAIRKAAMEKALEAREQKKQRKKNKPQTARSIAGHGLVVIPPTLGRDLSRPDAIQTLRSHLNVVSK